MMVTQPLRATRPMFQRLTSPSWAVLEYGWYPLLLFATMPWFLHRLGAEPYGYWMLLTATVGFGGALNAGTGAATIKTVSSTNGHGASREQHVRASLAIAMVGGTLLSLLVLIVFLHSGTLVLGHMAADTELIRVTGIAAAILLWLEQIDNVASSTMKGIERFGYAARLEIFGKSLQIGLAAGVTCHWPTLGAVYTALVAGALLRLAAKFAIVRHLLGAPRLLPSLNGARDILRLARWGWLQGVGGVLFGVMDRMLVGSMLGAATLAYYSIASQLAMQVHAISAAAFSVIFPMVSRRFDQPTRMLLRPLVKLTMWGNLAFSSFIAVTLLLLAKWVLALWIGAEAAAVVGQLLPWLVAAYWLLAINVAPYYILLGMGRMRFIGITVLTAGVVALVTLYAAIECFGLPGAPAGRGVYAMVALMLVLPIFRHLRHETRPAGASRTLADENQSAEQAQ